MSGDTGKAVSESSPTDDFRQKLRQKWELASVLNFLHVFEPVLETKMKYSAEDIETALIEFNDSLVQLHIAILKGITTSKLLNGSEVWVTVLCRELRPWWTWVAQDDFPLTAAKGEELSRYKELDPTVRLLVLKAVCEVRAAQDDIASFINESIKEDTPITTFRKEKLADENGTAYWYDGDEIIGHRLYREINQFKKRTKGRGKEAVSDTYFQWEPVATNLEEFRRVMDEFSSSELKSEVTVSKTLEVDVIPVLEKLEKKKQRALKKMEKQNAPPRAFQSSRPTRSLRNLKPVSYTYDEYDRQINEALKVGAYNNDNRNQKIVDKPSRRTQRTVSTDEGRDVLESPHGISAESDSDIDGCLLGNDVDHRSSDDEHGNEIETTRDEDKNEVSDSDERRYNFSNRGSRIVDHGAPESMNINSKNRTRQRPSLNTAFDFVPDSEEEILSNISSMCIVPDSEEENSSNNSEKRRRT